MSPSEIVIGVIGLLVGYWVVAALIRNKPTGNPPAERPAPFDPFAGRADAGAIPWYATLGVPPDADPERIRAAYRTLMSQYHPDKVASLGVELQALAERKSKEIGAACRQGLALHGIRD